MQVLRSTCPATGDLVWEGPVSGPEDVVAAVAAARIAFASWRETSLEGRIALARGYAALVRDRADWLGRLIARETGKPLWEALQEAGSIAGKVELAIRALGERAGEREEALGFGRAVLRHRPHGVMAVLGPYNFPGHLPNGHIVPALLAGNCVVFKPSEETPGVGAALGDLWAEAGLPSGVLSVVQGGRDTGAALVDADIDGLLFTGSATTGTALRRATIDRPGLILALELGGNNPLIAWDGEPEAIASLVVSSAFATSGQRCSCARRLIIPAGASGDRILNAVVALAGRLRIGAWADEAEPAMGPLISERAADVARSAVDAILDAGAAPILGLRELEGRSGAFMSPVVLDVTGLDVPDAEIFAPVLQVVRVPDFDAAVDAANTTAFGLSAGLISADEQLWKSFLARSRAGVVNWNRPTTGASGSMPFGGLGLSGNHRPSGYYAADYCAYPVASFESEAVADLSGEIRGLMSG